MRNFYLTIFFSLLSFSFNGLSSASQNPYSKDFGSQENSKDEECSESEEVDTQKKSSKKRKSSSSKTASTNKKKVKRHSVRKSVKKELEDNNRTPAKGLRRCGICNERVPEGAPMDFEHMGAGWSHNVRNNDYSGIDDYHAGPICVACPGCNRGRSQKTPLTSCLKRQLVVSLKKRQEINNLEEDDLDQYISDYLVDNDYEEGGDARSIRVADIEEYIIARHLESQGSSSNASSSTATVAAARVVTTTLNLLGSPSAVRGQRGGQLTVQLSPIARSRVVRSALSYSPQGGCGGARGGN